MCGFEYRKEFLKTLVLFILLGEMITKDLRTEKKQNKKKTEKNGSHFSHQSNRLENMPVA